MGEIPAWLAKLANLHSLFLVGNSFTGCIPEALQDLTVHDLDQLGIPFCGRGVLVAIYNATGGANWTNNTNWLSDRPIGEWYGVNVDYQGHVIGLDLWENQLTGTIPTELGSLSNLRWLNLSGNQLTGAIPTELDNLSNLTHLDLWGNQLTGTTPTQLGNLSNLEGLGLGGNQLTGTIPMELGNLSNLTQLDLWGNQLTGTIPTQLGSLSNLTGLDLGENQLTGTIPMELGNLSNLTQLGLWQNQLTGTIPSQLGNLSDLEWLDLSGNRLTGTIPGSFTSLTSLTSLFFRDNAGLCAPTDDAFQTWLQGLEQVEGDNCTSVEDFEADRDVLVRLYDATDGPNWEDSSNWLSDRPMESWFGVTTDDEGHVIELRLPHNLLSGQIPTELGNLSSLTRLSLWDNQLSGTVPSELSRLANLTYLWLNQNKLTGEIPRRLTDLTMLESLTFESNAGLCAPIDSAFQTWLQGIDVHGSSCAPQDSQDDRDVLAILYNATNGANWEDNSNWQSNRPVREWYGVTNDANGRATGLYLGENKLTGSIPTELGKLSEMTWLILLGNQLTGSIPSELGNLSKLRGLHLRDNQLTGCIPAALQDVVFNDFDRVGLSFCLPQAPGAPTVSATTAGSVVVRLQTAIPVTATFSKPVNGFTVGDITVANGDVGNFSGSDGDMVYTFDVTPNAIGVVTVDIAAGVAQDSVGDGNTAAVQLTIGLPYDDDHDGTISRDEVITAIRDYLFGSLLTRNQVVALIGLYLFG